MKLLKLTVLILTTSSLVKYNNANCMEIGKRGDINYEDNVVDSVNSTVLKITNRSLNETFTEQIKKSIEVEMKYFYKNTPSDSTGNCNNGLQCMVFTSYLLRHTCNCNPDIAELAYCSLNEKYQKLYKQSCFRKIGPQADVERRKAEIMKNCRFSEICTSSDIINHILDYEQMLASYSDLRDYQWGWLLGNNDLQHKELDNTYAHECTAMVFSFTTWLSCTNDLFRYIKYFPAIVGEIFNVILYYTRIYKEFLECSEHNLSQSNTDNNEIITMEFQYRFNLLHRNISKINKLKIIEIAKIEQKNLLNFTRDLIKDIWNKFVITNSNPQQLSVFECVRYREYAGELHTIQDRFKEQMDLIAYRFYTVCRKVCELIPYICNFGSETEKIQDSYYNYLQNSYIAKKAIVVYAKQLKFICETDEKIHKEYNSSLSNKNKTNAQLLNQNIYGSTVCAEIDKEQLPYMNINNKQTLSTKKPSMSIEKSINITAENRSTKKPIFKVEKNA